MNHLNNILHTTTSICPVCLKKIDARHVSVDGNIYLKKTCDQHGNFSAVIWRGEDKPDYYSWKKDKVWFHPPKCLSEVEKGCPYDCGLCSEHMQETCCVLLEVTGRCNLNCHFCFADSGDPFLTRHWRGLSSGWITWLKWASPLFIFRAENRR
jgi:uncharacterized radical SAM superfamily Fe-S cluster-containing enzyme